MADATPLEPVAEEPTMPSDREIAERVRKKWCSDFSLRYSEFATTKLDEAIIAALADVRSTARRQGEVAWQPIETAPKDRVTQILLWYPSDTRPEGFTFLGVWGYPTPSRYPDVPTWVDPDDHEALGDSPLRWMPLPSPPVTP